MGKNKLLLLVMLLIGIFLFKMDVYADTCGNYSNVNMTIKVYIADDDNSEFKEYDMTRAYIDNGILPPVDKYGDFSFKITPSQNNEDYYEAFSEKYSRSYLAEVIDDKYVLTIPQKDGYNFDGWYLDKELKNKVDNLSFKNTTSISNLDITLYGKWTHQNVQNNNKIYEFGKDEIYIIRLMKNPGFGCELYGEYIYIPSNNYISNINGNLEKLPVLSNLENQTFKGWYSSYENNDNNRISTIADLKEIVNDNDGGFIYLYPQYADRNDSFNTQENQTTVEKEKNNEKTNILYISIATIIITTAVAGTIIITINKNK